MLQFIMLFAVTRLAIGAVLRRDSPPYELGLIYPSADVIVGQNVTIGVSSEYGSNAPSGAYLSLFLEIEYPNSTVVSSQLNAELNFDSSLLNTSTPQNCSLEFGTITFPVNATIPGLYRIQWGFLWVWPAKLDTSTKPPLCVGRQKGDAQENNEEFSRIQANFHAVPAGTSSSSSVPSATTRSIEGSDLVPAPTAKLSSSAASKRPSIADLTPFSILASFIALALPFALVSGDPM